MSIRALPALMICANAFAQDDAQDDAQVAAQEMPLLAVERALGAPKATGLLVVAVSPGSQAIEQGITPGTILTTYDGDKIDGVDALRAAMGRTAADGDPVEVTCVAPDGTTRAVSLRPGPIGIADVRAVRSGAPGAALPEDTGVALSFVPVARPEGEWFRFLLEGKHVGFEYGTFSISDARITSSREVAFDGGQRWGVNRMAVEVEVYWGETVVPWRTTFANLLNDWRGEGQRGTGEDSTRWDVAWHHAPDSEEHFAWRLPDDLPLVPSYLVEYLARAMPRKAGACFVYRPLHEGMGQTGLPCALVVVGPEEIEVGGEAVDTWCVEQRELGATGPVRYWVDAEHRARRIDYRGGAVAELATSRESALEGLPGTLAPRTAGDR